MNKLALVNNFAMTKKFLNAKFDCTITVVSRQCPRLKLCNHFSSGQIAIVSVRTGSFMASHLTAHSRCVGTRFHLSLNRKILCKHFFHRVHIPPLFQYSYGKGEQLLMKANTSQIVFVQFLVLFRSE